MMLTWPTFICRALSLPAFLFNVCLCEHSCFSLRVLFAVTFDTAVANIAARHVIFLWQMLENFRWTNESKQHPISQGFDPESWIADSLLPSLECSLDWNQKYSSCQDPVIVLTSAIYNTSQSRYILPPATCIYFTTGMSKFRGVHSDLAMH